MKITLQLSIFFLFSFLFFQNTFAQEIIKKGAHQLQKEEFGNIEKTNTDSEENKENIIPLQ